MICRSIALQHLLFYSVHFSLALSRISALLRGRAPGLSSVSMLELYFVTLRVTITCTVCRMLITCSCIIYVLVCVQFQWYMDFYENSEERAIWQSCAAHSSVADDSHLRWEPVLLAEQFLTFWRLFVPSSSRVKQSPLTAWLHSFEMLGNTNPRADGKWLLIIGWQNSVRIVCEVFFM